MKGGFNNPPNIIDEATRQVDTLTSMKGGFNNPPNVQEQCRCHQALRTSMKGGFNNPPNRIWRMALSRSNGKLQ